MPVSKPHRLAVCLALLAGLAPALPAAEILIGDAKSSPESLTVAPGGTLIVGSASSPFVYKVRPGSTTAEKFIDASAEPRRNVFLRHARRCRHQHLVDLSADARARRHARAAAHRVARLRSRNRRAENSAGTCLATAAPATISPSGRTRRSTSPIPPTAKSTSCPPVLPAAQLFLEDPRALWHRRHYLPQWHAIREQCVLEQSLPHSHGRRRQGGQPVDIWMDQPIKGPDGMRAANGKLTPRRERQRQDFRYYRPWR